MAESNRGWEGRILCSDGNCIGVVGADGRCKLCGKPYGGDLPAPTEEPEKADDAIDDSWVEEKMEPAKESESKDPEADSEALDGSWENRTLCIDENCIGVVGPDGRCNECGKPYTG